MFTLAQSKNRPLDGGYKIVFPNFVLMCIADVSKHAMPTLRKELIREPWMFLWQIYDGRNVWADRLARLTGHYGTTEMIYRSSGPEMLVRMTTDNSETDRGFMAMYHITEGELQIDIIIT